ncbi:MAG: hypothetical protein KJ914_04245 [Gammaproteobacteria bacterium]|nr:hypothetical protein [Gammaproteobacteria bacterium]MBU1723020.1 hypothetical protein [Gammaproteobacteria bacterium]MBU2003821.1 hypothetical protein [Gammaproteobacteria bacterium]
MNVHINVEMTPEELRRLMGLPDVQEFNQKVMEQMLKKLQEGAEGFDPSGIFKASIMSNTDAFKQWMSLFNGLSGGKGAEK